MNRVHLFDLIFLLCIAVCSVVIPASAGPQASIERVPYVFPPYESAPWAAMYCTKQQYDEAAADKNFQMEKITYASDGLRVHAYLYRPQEIKGKYPVVIFNRGSYTVGNVGGALTPQFRRLAQAGFVVVAPLYRGSDGGEGRDEMGGADLNDLKNLLPVLTSLGFVEVENLFLYGESRGGMMTYQALRDGFPARAAATFGSFTDLGALFTENPRSGAMANSIWPDFDARKSEILVQRSALQWSEKLAVPLLIMHGGADATVSPSHAMNLAEKLRQAGKTYELVIYGGDNHVLRENKEDRDQRAIRWFRKFMAAN